MLANNIFVSITCVTNSLVRNLYSITAEFCKVFGTFLEENVVEYEK